METFEQTNSTENRTSEPELATRHINRLTKWKKRGRVSVVVLSIILVCGVISLPSILYNFVPKAFNIAFLPDNATASKCQMKVYSNTGSPCYSLLQQFQDCFTTTNSDELYIDEKTDTTTSDSIVGLISLAISLYGSELCEEDLIPFMCLYLFPICDKSGSIFYPSSQDCLYISTDVCRNEWQKVIEFGEESLLPKCNTLPTESTYRTCIDDSYNETSLAHMMVNTSEYQCSDDFFTFNGTCRPRCDRWVTNKGLMLEISAIISASLGTVCAVFFSAIIIHQRRTMFIFPKVLIIYITGDAEVLLLLVLTNYMDRSRLFCTSPDLITSLSNPSTFCNASGATFMFLLLHMSLLWFLHVVTMFIKLKWPLMSRRVALAGYYKYLHVLCFLISSIMPILPIVVVLETSGFATFTFPPLFCTPTNREVTFYSIILPVSVLLAIGSSLLIIVLWIIWQHNRNVLKENNSQGQLTLNTSERKLVITLCYYVVLGTMTLAAFSMSARNIERYASELGMYFSCIETGANQDCQQYKDKAEADTPLELAITAYLLLGLFPVVNLMYIIRLRRILFFLQSFTAKMGVVSICQTKHPPTRRGDGVQSKIPNHCIVVVNTKAQVCSTLS